MFRLSLPRRFVASSSYEIRYSVLRDHRQDRKVAGSVPSAAIDERMPHGQHDCIYDLRTYALGDNVNAAVRAWRCDVWDEVSIHPDPEFCGFYGRKLKRPGIGFGIELESKPNRSFLRRAQEEFIALKLPLALQEGRVESLFVPLLSS